MDMTLEEAVARGLVAARRDPTLALVLTVVLLDNPLASEALHSPHLSFAAPPVCSKDA